MGRHAKLAPPDMRRTHDPARGTPRLKESKRPGYSTERDLGLKVGLFEAIEGCDLDQLKRSLQVFQARFKKGEHRWMVQTAETRIVDLEDGADFSGKDDLCGITLGLFPAELCIKMLPAFASCIQYAADWADLRVLQRQNSNVAQCFLLVSVLKFPEARSAAVDILASGSSDKHAVKAVQAALEKHRGLPRERQKYLQANFGVLSHGPAQILGGLAKGTQGDPKLLAQRLGAWCNAEVAKQLQKLTSCSLDAIPEVLAEVVPVLGKIYGIGDYNKEWVPRSVLAAARSDGGCPVPTGADPWDCVPGPVPPQIMQWFPRPSAFLQQANAPLLHQHPLMIKVAACFFVSFVRRMEQEGHDVRIIAGKCAELARNPERVYQKTDVAILGPPPPRRKGNVPQPTSAGQSASSTDLPEVEGLATSRGPDCNHNQLSSAWNAIFKR